LELPSSTRAARQILETPDRLTLTETDATPRWFGFLILLLAAIIPLVFLAAGFPEERWLMLATGSSFALVGYCIAFHVSRVQIDLAQRRWRQQLGIFPFVRSAEGSLYDWDHLRFYREQRTMKEESEPPFDVWCVSLIARGGHRLPLTLPGFEFPCETVSRLDAMALAQQLANKLDLPLGEEDEQGEPHTSGEPSVSPPVSPTETSRGRR